MANDSGTMNPELERLLTEAGGAPGGAERWRAVDAALRQIAKIRAEQDHQIGMLLLEAARTLAHQRFGFASVYEYAENVLGFSPRKTEERLRVARELQSLPVLSEALRSGRRPWAAVRELTRVAVPDTEEEWLESTEGWPVHRIEEKVSGHRRGSRPQDRPDPSLRRRTLSFPVSPEGEALVREAIDRVRRETDFRLTEEEALVEMARRTLSGPADEGRAPYQIALTVCEDCGRTTMEGGGRQIEVPSHVAEQACCDGQHIGRVDDPETPAETPHVGEPADKAHQDIPPAVRRKVIRRDGGRCRVPGCRNRHFLDLHHIVLRSEGGSHDPLNLVTVCGTHHALCHKGFLWIDRTDSGDLLFRHADGTVYGHAPRPAEVQTSSDAFGALRSLGLKDTEARTALQAARTHVGAEASLEVLIKKSLEIWRAGRSQGALSRREDV